MFDYGLLFTRLGFASVLFGYHGWGRMIQIYNYAVLNQPWPFIGVVQKLGFPLPPAFALLSAMSEAIGTILIALGLFTRPAAAMISISMAVATYSKVSKGESFELPCLYLLGAAVFAITGPGRFSLDSVTMPRLFTARKHKARAAAIS